jgi:aspartyl-tRNA(Asn)/glutamyl-tRNA(Gln) amidotransferase subunit C
MGGDNTASPCESFAGMLDRRLVFALFHTLLTMALTPADVSRIAHLARLELSDAESQAMLGQLNDFFGIVEQMSAIDTRGVEPLYTPLAAVQPAALRLRDDVVTEPNRRERNQASAPLVEDGLYLVPKVIE